MNSDPRRSTPRVTTARQAHRRARGRGFTLVELIAVLALLAVLSAAAVPAMNAMQRSRERAATTEIARLIALAQRRAVATGERTGVRIEPDAGVVTVLRLPEGAPAPVPIEGVTGDQRRELQLSDAFGGVSIEFFRSGDGAAGTGEVWFDASGSPNVRRGGDLTPSAEDARVGVSGGEVILVRAVTGAVEW